MKRYFHRLLACLALCAMLLGPLSVPASAAEFEDVPDSHWAAASIRQCVELGFFNGETATRFGIGHQMTRSAFAVVLCRFFGWEPAAPAETVFSDVDANAWYAGAIAAAYDHGAITNQRNEFRPTDPVTREELAVMLVRALGYGSIAGLNQSLPNPFQDVTTNAGYITMAYQLGLISGTSADTFSPARPASREQVAVILMRLYNKLQNAPETLAIVSSPEELAGVSIAAIPAFQLVSSTIRNAMVPEAATAVRDAARQAGIPALLYVTGSSHALNDTDTTAANLLDAVQAGNYDGLFLDLSKLTSSKSRSMVQLAAKLNASLEDKLLYLAVEAPVKVGRNYTGYQYASLSSSADKLVARLSAYEVYADGFMIAPHTPPEEIFYTLSTLKEEVGTDKLSLMLTPPTYSAWLKDDSYSLSDEEFNLLLTAPETATHYSERYGSFYLISPMPQKRELVIWHLDEKGLEQRIQLAGLLGLNQICLTD